MYDINKAWYFGRASIEALVQGFVILLVTYFVERMFGAMIVINIISPLVYPGEDVIIIVVVVILSLFITNLLFVVLHEVNIINSSIIGIVSTSIISAMLETILFMSLVFFFVHIVLSPILVVTIINYLPVMLSVFVTMLVLNTIFDIIFSRVRRKKESVKIIFK